MMIQLILILAFVTMFLRFLVNPDSHQIRAGTKLFMVFFVVLAVIVILFPNISNSVARFVGVTRGADLLLYLLTLAFVFLVMHLYVRGKQEQKRTVQLTRKVALLEAELKYGSHTNTEPAKK